ncbi:response regulator transcription factor [Inhella crocodyli]|uniref:response regulator transcription factor n=1 Tax=Inhella crocodyli TaxID=2499851 RepID=UPI0013E2CDC7|nr:response regulator [Inhella crocodyli]
MKPKILIVDDQADIRRLVRFALEDAGFALFEAPNGQLALQLARALRPDLIVLDQVMPGDVDGLDVLQALQAESGLSGTLTLMLTSRQEPRDKQTALAAGANYFLTKPFSPARLLEVVMVMLKSRDTAPH